MAEKKKVVPGQAYKESQSREKNPETTAQTDPQTEGAEEATVELDDLGLHNPTLQAIIEVIYEERQRLKKEIDRMQSLGNTGRYRSPHYMGVGKAVWPVRSVIDMESEAMACLDTLEKTLRALGSR